MATRSSLQGILENLRDAAVDFAKPYQPPANIPAALADLLKQLGIADPGAAVKAQLDNAAKNWGTLGNQLSGLNLDFTDPARALQDIDNKAKAVKQSIDAILSTPNAIWDGLGAAGAAIKSVFPTRLLDYILYEALTKSNPKIGGAFLLFGVLRREFTPAPSAAFVPANVRIFDLEH